MWTTGGGDYLDINLKCRILRFYLGLIAMVMEAKVVRNDGLLWYHQTFQREPNLLYSLVGKEKTLIKTSESGLLTMSPPNLNLGVPVNLCSKQTL